MEEEKMKKENQKENKKPKNGRKMPFPPTESAIEYQGSGFWLTVSSPALKESKETFTELYDKLKLENSPKRQEHYR